MCAFLHVQMESNWAGLSVCDSRHTGKWCGTIKAVGNTDHTRQTWIHLQTPLSPLAGCSPVGEGTSGKVLNWTVRSLNHLHHHFSSVSPQQWSRSHLLSGVYIARQLITRRPYRWGLAASTRFLMSRFMKVNLTISDLTRMYRIW